MSAHPRVPAHAALILASAILAGGCVHASAPAVPASADIEPRLTLLHPDEGHPDVRLTLNHEAYVALILMYPDGAVDLLNQRGSSTSKHFEEGVHFFQSQDMHGPTNRPIRIAPLAGQEIRNFRPSRDMVYMAIATAVPLDVRQAVEGGECGFSATDHAALVEELQACLLGDGETEAGIAVARWPTELVSGFAR